MHVSITPDKLHHFARARGTPFFFFYIHPRAPRISSFGRFATPARSSIIIHASAAAFRGNGAKRLSTTMPAAASSILHGSSGVHRSTSPLERSRSAAASL